MMKNLAVFFDGTWNEPNDRTNVYELYKAAPETSTQETLYIEGVGTQGQGLWTAIDKFVGGAFGAGLSANIRQGYRWLCQRHTPGDRIFLFGFSRGAYSARSLAGMVRKCGLLNQPTEDNVSEAYALYRDDCTPSSLEAAAFRDRFSRDTDLHFVGVWDTVGALGVPGHLALARRLNRGLGFHDTRLSGLVRAARHAVAIDERRRTFPPTLWDNLDAMNGVMGAGAEGPYAQRWFPGDHGSVGGGGAVTALSDEALVWVAEGAAAAGLALDPAAVAAWRAGRDCLGPLGSPKPLLRRLLMLDSADRGVEWMIDRLVRLDDNPHHRRAKLVILTARGQRVHDEAERRQGPWANLLVTGLTQDQIANALHVLRTLRARVEPE